MTNVKQEPWPTLEIKWIDSATIGRDRSFSLTQSILLKGGSPGVVTRAGMVGWWAGDLGGIGAELVKTFNSLS